VIVYHAVIRSWNQPVLSNAGKVSCYRKQKECFILIFLCVISYVLFYKRMWYPLSATRLTPYVCGCSLRKGNVIFIFNRGESSFVVLLIMLLSSLFSFMFFYTASFFFSDLADLLHFVHSDIYLISQASFFLRIISKLGNSLYLADLLHFVHSDIYLISQASFFVRIISKLGNSFYLADFFPQPLIT